MKLSVRQFSETVRTTLSGTPSTFLHVNVSASLLHLYKPVLGQDVAHLATRLHT